MIQVNNNTLSDWVLPIAKYMEYFNSRSRRTGAEMH